MTEPGHRHQYSESTRGTHEQCRCGDRLPCANRGCSHWDCQTERIRRGSQKHLRCHWCEAPVEGPRDGSWTTWVLHGATCVVHYACRDQRATDEDRARWGSAIEAP